MDLFLEPGGPLSTLKATATPSEGLPLLLLLLEATANVPASACSGAVGLGVMPKDSDRAVVVSRISENRRIVAAPSPQLQQPKDPLRALSLDLMQSEIVIRQPPQRRMLRNQRPPRACKAKGRPCGPAPNRSTRPPTACAGPHPAGRASTVVAKLVAGRCPNSSPCQSPLFPGGLPSQGEKFTDYFCSMDCSLTAFVTCLVRVCLLFTVSQHAESSRCFSL